jgi:hypothetical protein
MFFPGTAPVHFDEYCEGKVNELCTFAHKSPHPPTTSYTINPCPVLINNSHDYNQICSMWPKGNADYPANFHMVLGDCQPEAVTGGFWSVSIRIRGLLYYALCPSPREIKDSFQL